MDLYDWSIIQLIHSCQLWKLSLFPVLGEFVHGNIHLNGLSICGFL